MLGLSQTWSDALRPPPEYDPASWAEARRVLTSAETPEPGPWRNDRFPPGIEPMQRLALHDPCQRVVLMFAAQLIKSEICNNLIGYIVDHSPCPIMMLRPTIDDAEGFSKQRLRHLFDGPSLKGKVKEPRARDSGNTLMLKEFPGGLIILAGANAPARLASWPVRVLVADEVDRYPESAGTEGDPLTLARARMSAFGLRAKELDASTPTIKGRSRIESEYLASSMALYHVPCPHCGEKFVITWDRLCYSGNPEIDSDFAAWLECPACAGRIEEHRKAALLAGGEWVHEHPDRRVKGYKINALYAAPGRLTWRQIASEWIRANDRAKVGDTSLLQVFINTRLAETWEDRGERVDPGNLEARREPFPAKLPANIRAITAGVDVQDDRLEVEVVGWGAGMESWSLGYYVIPTDPLDRGTWQALDDILLHRWTREDAIELSIAATCVDSGYRTQAVREFCRGRSRRRVMAIKGVAGGGRPIWDRKIRKSGKNKDLGSFHAVGVDTAKDALQGYLRITAPGPGYAHFPSDRDSLYFAMLTSEKRCKIKDRRGRESWEWRLITEGTRNEALDCRVYALAALYSLLASGLRMEPVARAPRPVEPPPEPVRAPVATTPRPSVDKPLPTPKDNRVVTGRDPRGPVRPFSGGRHGGSYPGRYR